jgi:integrase
MSTVKRRGSSWQATVRGPDGRERTATFRTRVEGDGWAADQVSAMNRGAWVDPQAGKVTFREYAEQWKAIQVHRSSTAAQVESHLRRHVLPFIGDRPIAAIRTSELQAWAKGRAAVLQPATVEVVYRYVVAIFLAAIQDKVIAASPAVGIRLPRIEPRRVEPLEVETVEALIAAVPDRYRALVVFAAGTGMRQGECFGLTVDRVNFLRRQVTVDRQLVLEPKTGPAFGPPKTAASYRTIPLPAVVLEALAAHLRNFPAGPDGFVFTNDAGGPIRRTRFSDVWRPAVAVAGAPVGTGFHALRHFYASLLIRHGESVKVVQSRLGHASAAETLDTYSHLWPDSEDRTRAAVDHVLRARTLAEDATRGEPPLAGESVHVLNDSAIAYEIS